jgi:hypothetical protein
MLLLLTQPFGLPSPTGHALSPQGECKSWCQGKADVFAADKDARIKFCANNDCASCDFCSPATTADCDSHGDTWQKQHYCDDVRAEAKRLQEEPPPKVGLLGSCYADANLGSNQCGPISKATCTGNGLGEAKGKCCSKGGYCGSDSTYCGDDMQKEYSYGNNVCPKVEVPVAVPADPATGEKACYADANLGSNQCGPAIGATCTGKGLGTATGVCCSATGYCGNDKVDYCNENMQVEYSHGNNVCPKEGETQEGTQVKPATCLKDGNKASSMCGPALQMTCTGSHGLGKCCSSTGWCGNDPEFCGEGMQEEYSNGKNLCADELPEGASSIEDAESKCMTLDQVAVAWVSAVAKLDKTDAKSMCVPAVIVAAGSTFNSPLCEDLFDPTVEAPGYMTTLKGLWQIADEVYDKDPKKQAAVAYDVYTGNNVTYGCNAEWCSMVQQGCSASIVGIGQEKHEEENCGEEDPEIESTCHRFCKGVWSGAATAIPIKLEALGGMAVVEAACEQASKGISAWSAVPPHASS